MNEDCTCVEEVLVVQNPIATQTIPEDGEPVTIDLANVFSLENPSIQLVPIPSSDPGADGNPDAKPEPVSDLPIVEAEIVDGQIVIDPIDNQNGVQEFEVIATTDDGQTTKDSFAVVVTPEDDPLALKEEIPDVDFVANQNMISIKVNDFFADPDSTDDITLAIKSNTNSELIPATLDGDNLIIESDLTAPGETEITIEATNGSEIIEDTFTVAVDENICIKYEGGTEPLLDAVIDTIDVIGFDSSRGSRLYTANSKEIEFLTGNEADDLELSPSGYRGLTGEGEGVVAVSRFYNQSSDSHFYSVAQQEVDFVNNLDNYTNEGTDHYAYTSDSINPDSVPLYRFYNQGSDSHFFSLDQSEGSGLMSEGIAYHVLPGSSV